MRFVFYTHSLASDWNHGNAHFLRGVMRALMHQGHEALALEQAGGWSMNNLIAEQGREPLEKFQACFPDLQHQSYDEASDHEALIGDADVVIVHEWTDPDLVAALGRLRSRGGRFVLLFHDTHHRAVSAEADMAKLRLDGYDGVLAFGETLRERYLKAGWGRRVHVWHEAADTTLFHPKPEIERSGGVVWIGNWGDGERSAELLEYLINPVWQIGLDCTAYGVRYPAEALAALRQARIRYRGWIANTDVPDVFARHRATVHIPRGPYLKALPGIPTIRVFEALACGIPLVCSPWSDSEGLFRPGKDYLQAADGQEMRRHLADVLNDQALAADLAQSGLETIRARHSCDHRVSQLLEIVSEIGLSAASRRTETEEIAS